ncbi:MAG: 1,4-dihydroxy-6-naphthoate synthase [Dactylosporangium sp.]|nr:1,4-dihydroxy-6-naphthoate synthase [Dactylosporangium sp.]NNJ59541.1 1,4-dihydroxy-6-naphthoate synthase [Dactylosporangium sp.]
MALSIAFSSCPNDTFVFHALVRGLLPGVPAFDVTHADVDVTNTSAGTGQYDIVKVSYAALPWLLDQYTLLPCGGALGRGCGPLVVVRDLASAGPADGDGDLAGRTVVVPGERTTASLLLRLWSASRPPASVTVLPFSEIMPAVAAGRFDAGLVIHEARFTHAQYGLRALVDLGDWWEADTGLPIPLGAILARRPAEADGGVDPAAAAEWIRASVRYAWAHPAASDEYVLSHAQETAPDVVSQHIALYVNRFTEDLGDEGYRAAETLLRRAAERGLAPAVGPLR